MANALVVLALAWLVPTALCESVSAAPKASSPYTSVVVDPPSTVAVVTVTLRAAMATLDGLRAGNGDSAASAGRAQLLHADAMLRARRPHGALEVASEVRL